MAANLAASIRVMDPQRRICLVHDADRGVPSPLRELFDDAVGLSPDPLYPHVMNKLRLFDISPYDGTMFVDADCLLVKRDVDRHWRAASLRPFSITGVKRTQGEWKGVRVEEVLRQEGGTYLMQMNAGVFYFDKSKAAAEFFRGLNAFYLQRRESLNISIYRGERTQTDELYIGVFMGLRGMNCDNMNNLGHDSWMVSTWRALHCSFDPRLGQATIYKSTALPFHVTRLSPTFAHFIGLRPRRTYLRLARSFRQMAGEQRSLSPAT